MPSAVWFVSCASVTASAHAAGQFGAGIRRKSEPASRSTSFTVAVVASMPRAPKTCARARAAYRVGVAPGGQGSGEKRGGGGVARSSRGIFARARADGRTDLERERGPDRLREARVLQPGRRRHRRAARAAREARGHRRTRRARARGSRPRRRGAAGSRRGTRARRRRARTAAPGPRTRSAARPPRRSARRTRPRATTRVEPRGLGQSASSSSFCEVGVTSNLLWIRCRPTSTSTPSSAAPSGSRSARSPAASAS